MAYTKMKLLSYIVPLYNSAKWLEKCLYSILNQDISEDQIEIICVDDGSPDNSAEIVRYIAEKYHCISLLTQTNQGPSAARNTGIRYAMGKYLCFVDPDDYVEPNSTRVLLDQMEKENLDILRFGYQMVDEEYNPCMPYKHYIKPNIESHIMTGKEYLCKRLGYSCFIWTYIYRTAIIKDNNLYCSEGVYFDDTDWLPKVLLKAERLNCINIVRQYYLIRSGSLVNSNNITQKKRKIEGSIEIIRILREDKKQHKDKDILSWYQQMISVHALSALTLIATDFYDRRKELIKQLKLYEAFKLSLPISGYICQNKWKLLLMNFSPMLYCILVHLKNKQ